MKKATLEATDENILQSIKEQKGTERNTEIMEFISKRLNIGRFDNR